MGYGMMDEIEGLREELKQTQLVYQLAARMSQFKAGFLARTAHELRSPLSSLMGLHQLILTDLCEDPQEEREFIKQAYQSAQKLLKILDEIIMVSKLDYGTTKLTTAQIQLSQVFEELYQLTHLQAANRNLRLEILAPEAQIYITADWQRLLQVLTTLVDTAISQMQGGRIKIAADLAQGSNFMQIMIDMTCSYHVWNEPTELLQPPLEQTPESLKSFAHQLELSPGMKFLMAQMLLEVMQGRLEVLDLTSETQTPLTRLQCSIPLASAGDGVRESQD